MGFSVRARVLTMAFLQYFSYFYKEGISEIFFCVRLHYHIAVFLKTLDVRIILRMLLLKLLDLVIPKFKKLSKNYF